MEVREALEVFSKRKPRLAHARPPCNSIITFTRMIAK
jgi:hypothetical protein